jgi:drug/metabolite transporter (DMT)-like permease
VRDNLKYMAALVAVALVWALTFPFTKIAVEGGYRTYGITLLSSSLTIVMLAVVVGLRRSGLPLHWGAIWRYVMSGILGTVVFAGTTYKAAEHLPSGVITVCMATLPLVSFFVSLALQMERATAGRIAGLTLGLVGVLLIALPETSLPNPAAAIFIPLAILSVLSFAVEGIVLGKYGMGGLDPLQLLLGAAVVAVAMTAPIAWATGTLRLPQGAFCTAEWAIVGSAVANTAAYAGYFWIVGRAGPVFAAQGSYMVTGFGVLWSILLLGEVYSPWIWAGMVVILAGMTQVLPKPKLATAAQ